MVLMYTNTVLLIRDKLGSNSPYIVELLTRQLIASCRLKVLPLRDDGCVLSVERPRRPPGPHEALSNGSRP